MPKPSVFDDMTTKEVLEFELEFERRQFKRIDSMVQWLSEKGFDVSRSAVGRKGAKLKERFNKRLDRVKAATLMSEIIARETADEHGKIADGLITLVQSDLFDAMSNLDEASETDDPQERLKLLGMAAKASADVGRASVMTKKFRREIEADIRKKMLEEAVKGIDKLVTDAQSGRRRLDAETLAAVRQDVYGLAG